MENIQIHFKQQIVNVMVFSAHFTLEYTVSWTDIEMKFLTCETDSCDGGGMLIQSL